MSFVLEMSSPRHREVKEAAQVHKLVGERPKASPPTTPLCYRGVSSKVVLVCSGCRCKVHTLGGLTSKKVLSHSSGGWESKVGISAGLVPPEAVKGNLFHASPSSWLLPAILAFLGLWTHRPNLCLRFHVASSPCVRLCVQASPFFKDTSHIGTGLTRMISF